MSDQPFVSVITPCYNAEDFLEESIQSVLGQTFQNFEYFIMDNASTDRSWEIIQDFARKDSRIIPHHNDELLNNASRNQALARARGKYVLWQDADDISYPERFEKQLAFMEVHPDVGICGCWIETFDDNGVIATRKFPVGDSDIRSVMYKYSPVAQAACIARLECYKTVGDYDVEYEGACDMEMSFRIGTRYKFGNVPEVLYKYRQHGKAVTNRKMRLMLRQVIRIRKEYAASGYYQMTLSDYLALWATKSCLLLPVKTIKWSFDRLRKLFGG